MVISSVISRLAEILIQSSLLIAAVFVLRSLSGGRLDKRLRYYLWLPVIMRMLLPFSVGSRLSVMNIFALAPRVSAEGIVTPADTDSMTYAAMMTGEPALSVQQTAARCFPWEAVILCLWAAGAIAVAAITLQRNTLFYGRLKKDRRVADVDMLGALCSRLKIKRAPAVYISDSVMSPCAFGIFRPAIYLPAWAVADKERLRYILLHELTHIKYRDNLFSMLISASCAVFWFDPLVWIMANSARSDRELACDAWVTEGMEPCEKTAYGMTLVTALQLQSGCCQRVCAPAFAARKNEMFDRIRSIKSDRPAAKWLTLIVCAAMACSLIAFGTSAKAAGDSLSESISEISPENVSEAQIHSVDNENEFIVLSPVLLGTAKECDSDTDELLKENFNIGGGWMEIEPYTDSDGTADLYNDLLNTAGTGTDSITHWRGLYQVINQTGVGQRVYVIGSNDLRRLGDRLFTNIRFGS